MRTKTLLLAAALSAAGLATSLAQSNVYSLNVVGYINLKVTNAASAGPGALYLFANQLDLDGTGANNTVLSVLGTGQGGTAYPPLTHAYAFSKAINNYVNCLWTGSAWSGDVAGVAQYGLQPGQGFFYEAKQGGPTTITLVGNVMQGNVSVPLPAAGGASLVSSKVPQAGGLAALGLSLPNTTTAQNAYIHASWEPTASYVNKLYRSGAWLSAGGEPQLQIGEAFWLNSAAGATWTRNFSVQ